MIEVEVRSFVSEDKFNKLRAFFEKNAEFLGEDEQETVYFNCKGDVRLQRSNSYSKIWMKEGRMHDEAREETEVKLDREDFEKAIKVFAAMGFEVTVKWLRKRRSYVWGNIAVTLDDNKGYGLILELEKLSSDEEKEAARNHLNERMRELGVEITPRDVFEEKFDHYTKNWRDLLNV